MKKLLRTRLFQTALPLAVGIATPFIVAFLSQIVIGNSLSEALAGVCGQAFLAPRQNLTVVTVLGLIPFAVLSLVVWLYLRKRDERRSLFLLCGGLAGILITVTPAHIDFWPTYFRSGYMGFPHGLEFLIMPFIALVPMAVGVLLGWLVTKTAWGGGNRG